MSEEHPIARYARLHAQEPEPMSPQEWAEYEEATRRQFTASLADDLEHIVQDVAVVAEKSPRLPVATALQELHAAIQTALEVVRAQVATDSQNVMASTITSTDLTRRPGLADYVDKHGGEWSLPRDPGESDEDFERRMALFKQDKDD